MHAHTHTHICMYTHTCTHTHTQICIHTHVCMWTSACTYRHMHTDTHRHTHTFQPLVSHRHTHWPYTWGCCKLNWLLGSFCFSPWRAHHFSSQQLLFTHFGPVIRTMVFTTDELVTTFLQGKQKGNVTKPGICQCTAQEEDNFKQVS